jgi:oleate hydratase
MEKKAYFVGSGIGSMAAAFFLIRDAGFQGKDIEMFEALNIEGGSMDGNGNEKDGFMCRGGRMLCAPVYECLQDMLKYIPSLNEKDKTVYQEIHEFDAAHPTHANSRLVDKNGQRYDVETMGFSQRDRMQLLALCYASEKEMKNTKITDWFSPEFFTTNFWYMWQTTFAFNPWSSAVELKRYMHRFMHEFIRIQTLEGVMRTPMNQYDSIIKPIQKWLVDRGVKPHFGCRVVDVEIVEKGDSYTAKKMVYVENGVEKVVNVREQDLCFIQNGSMTDSTSVGTWKTPAKLA